MNENDLCIKSGLENILNVQITDNIWNQASLHTKMGGLGIRKTSELSMSAYSSSIALIEQGVQELLGLISQENESLLNQIELCHSQEIS